MNYSTQPLELMLFVWQFLSTLSNAKFHSARLVSQGKVGVLFGLFFFFSSWKLIKSTLTMAM